GGWEMPGGGGGGGGWRREERGGRGGRRGVAPGGGPVRGSDHLWCNRAGTSETGRRYLRRKGSAGAARPVCGRGWHSFPEYARARWQWRGYPAGERRSYCHQLGIPE